MAKHERLLALLTLLRSKRYAVTASELAQTLSVSERTIYRDIKSLSHSGVPIAGEAGIGYVLERGSHLPPLMFTQQEMIALELGMRMVRSLSDKELAEASTTASAKIMSVLPDKLKKQVENFPMRVPDVHKKRLATKSAKILRHAINDQRKVQLTYTTEANEQTIRTIQPLGLIFWAHSWTLVSWCELRKGYRQFRLDRMDEIRVLEEKFEVSENKNLEHYVKTRAH
ncbi:WYL domain-containing protein [Vibrio sp. OCN044]|uniref:WYL domain-containing protein n=1 Tax=Vibrio tetraodonis subsp. pristinus TaxID=2695891 RepID=A0A6L8M052_9VIBR|nr:YafY family protein [Vibrio tetraodonis]MYM58899.1 WYL domain-containing protein [Vibrio tetraodonis subsp. pristinus]